jgi:2-polyprenyl-3-methyl-5-hydroxy-6-metoxy-1,4-benzoquinol methylase
LTGNPELIQQYRLLHATRAYGDTSVKSLRFLRAEIRLLKPRSILDYGCGQSRLLERLNLGYPADLIRYDPAIPEWAKKPDRRVDLLICIDVLEHIEEGDLDGVLDEMAGLCRNAMIVIDTRPAATILPDGRNAHATIKPHAWWRQRLARHFPALHPLATVRRSRAGFKTWSRSPRHLVAYTALRAADNARYYADRLVAKMGGH